MTVDVPADRGPPHLVARPVATWRWHLAHSARPLLQLMKSRPVVLLAFPSSCAVRGWADHLACLAMDVCAVFLDFGAVWAQVLRPVCLELLESRVCPVCSVQQQRQQLWR